jgi:hypothetical protein
MVRTRSHRRTRTQAGAGVAVDDPLIGPEDDFSFIPPFVDELHGFLLEISFDFEGENDGVSVSSQDSVNTFVVDVRDAWHTGDQGWNAANDETEAARRQYEQLLIEERTRGEQRLTAERALSGQKLEVAVQSAQEAWERKLKEALPPLHLDLDQKHADELLDALKDAVTKRENDRLLAERNEKSLSDDLLEMRTKEAALQEELDLAQTKFANAQVQANADKERALTMQQNHYEDQLQEAAEKIEKAEADASQKEREMEVLCLELENARKETQDARAQAESNKQKYDDKLEQLTNSLVEIKQDFQEDRENANEQVQNLTSTLRRTQAELAQLRESKDELDKDAAFRISELQSQEDAASKTRDDLSKRHERELRDLHESTAKSHSFPQTPIEASKAAIQPAHQEVLLTEAVELGQKRAFMVQPLQGEKQPRKIRKTSAEQRSSPGKENTLRETNSLVQDNVDMDSPSDRQIRVAARSSAGRATTMKWPRTLPSQMPSRGNTSGRSTSPAVPLFGLSPPPRPQPLPPPPSKRVEHSPIAEADETPGSPNSSVSLEDDLDSVDAAVESQGTSADGQRRVENESGDAFAEVFDNEPDDSVFRGGQTFASAVVVSLPSAAVNVLGDVPQNVTESGETPGSPNSSVSLEDDMDIVDVFVESEGTSDDGQQRVENESGGAVAEDCDNEPDDSVFRGGQTFTPDHVSHGQQRQQDDLPVVANRGDVGKPRALCQQDVGCAQKQRGRKTEGTKRYEKFTKNPDLVKKWRRGRHDEVIANVIDYVRDEMKGHFVKPHPDGGELVVELDDEGKKPKIRDRMNYVDRTSKKRTVNSP